ncbi:hypothetical protein FE374_18340 [Georgenia yuyongxinii]|uniref:Phosphodiesterase n=1 Tax=Georgenia yuyongxinii TaxID=2589797 RepID=A0A5B8C777_9MICO|nr:hypothetical protein [Georgenia yuyongxinii]QDC26308.1 hypothetical protein FE374_18340 [Georgenia yuyongxinii]
MPDEPPSTTGTPASTTAQQTPALRAPRTPPHLALAGVATLAGLALGASLAAVAVLRRGKPLHPRGVVVPARLTVRAGPVWLGALGRRGTHEVLARFSRAVGLPQGWPDIQGLALRWPGLSGPNDLLLASTGTGPWGRYMLTVRRRPLGGALGSLMPYATAAGPVLLSAQPTGEPRHLTLRWATPRGPWHPCADLVWDQAGTADAPVRFDPVRHCPDGLATYPWADRARRYAYRWARAAGPV